MANIKLLQEAIQAFASGETKTADAKMRKFFIEQAQEINKKIEEDLEQDPEQSMKDELEYELDESADSWGEMQVNDEELEFDDGKGSEGWVATDDPINEADEEEVSDEMAQDVHVEGDTWEDIRTAFDELEALFAEVEGEGEEVADEFEQEGEMEPDAEDDFSDIEFGSDEFKESVAAGRMKKVTPEKQTANTSKSPVAKRPESFVKGVSEIKIKDGSVDMSTTENVKTDVDVEDHDNTMDSAKGMMKNVKVPKETATTSKSPVAKRK